jgi:predicted RND superfamily exporter protein
VLFVVAVSFRGRLIATLFALTPVVLGVVWTLGIWGATGRPLDLVCLAVLPVILGLGIDDGLYAVHGAGGAARGIGRSVRRAGRAMVLTTLTTGVGFASLGLSHIPGLRSAAMLVPMAIVACLATTLLVLPAVAKILDRRPST